MEIQKGIDNKGGKATVGSLAKTSNAPTGNTVGSLANAPVKSNMSNVPNDLPDQLEDILQANSAHTRSDNSDDIMEITQSEMIIVQQSIKGGAGGSLAFGNVGKGTPAPV